MGFDKDNSFVSGEPGTTGREPFEGSYTSSSGATGTTGTGHHGHHGHHHGEHGSSGLGGAVGGTDPAVGPQGHGHSGGYSGVGEHSSGQFGGIANVGGNDGYTSGNTGGLTGDKYGSGGGVGTGREFDQTGNTKADSETGATHHTGHHHSGHHGAGTGLAAAAAGATGAGATGAGHHSTGPDVGVQRQEGSSLAGSGYDNNDDSSKYGNDRVGALGQNSSAYERTGADGPQTHGAAGTDRFDTDRSKTGNAGSGAGFGPGGERHTEYGGNTAEGYGGENDVDKRRKAEGTGGVGGLLTTTDKEFTGRDKLGGASGAYGDETGPFKGNKDGPGNNTALTGREGNYDNNPVAKDASKEVHPTRPSDSTTSNTTSSHSTTDAHDGEKKGIVEKIKDAFHA